MPYTVLVVDDDVKLTKLLKTYFDSEDFVTYLAHDGLDGLRQAKEKKPNIIILDLLLPGVDGWEICRRVRKEAGDVAILMLTAKDEKIDRLTGLDLGAGDYASKPFSPREIVERARAILRRTQKAVTLVEPIKIGDLLIDRERHEVSKCNKAIDLTPKEFKLLEIMATRANQTLTRFQLVEQIQGCTFEGYERTIDAHIKNLRHKIEDNPIEPLYMQTVYSIGYRFAGEEND